MIAVYHHWGCLFLDSVPGLISAKSIVYPAKPNILRNGYDSYLAAVSMRKTISAARKTKPTH